MGQVRHCASEPAPVLGPYVPAGQFEHVAKDEEPSTAEYVPAGHTWGEAPPPGQYQPRGQMTDAFAPVPVGQNIPAAQATGAEPGAHA
jgi:hypothetical protein